MLEPFQGSFVPTDDQATACTLLVNHLSMRRNKRCLLAYHRTRTDRLEELVWKGYDVVDLAGWQAIDREELARGAAVGRGRLKLLDTAEMVQVARTARKRVGGGEDVVQEQLAEAGEEDAGDDDGDAGAEEAPLEAQVEVGGGGGGHGCGWVQGRWEVRCKAGVTKQACRIWEEGEGG